MESIKELQNILLKLSDYNNIFEKYQELYDTMINYKNENIILKDKINELELELTNQKNEDLKNYNKVSVIQLMDKQISDKNNHIHILETQVKFYKNKLKSIKNDESNDTKDNNDKYDNDKDDKDDNDDEDDNDDYELILYKKKQYYLNNKNNKIYDILDNKPYNHVGNKENTKINFI